MSNPLAEIKPLAGLGAPGARAGQRGDFIKNYFVYPTDEIELSDAAGATAKGTATVNVSSSAAFFVTKMSYSILGYSATGVTPPPKVSVTNSSRYVAPITVDIQVDGSGRKFYQQPAYIDSVAGFGELPYILPVQKILPANSDLSIDFENLHPTESFAIQLFFHGYQLFQIGEY